MYKLINNEIVKRLSDNACIPIGILDNIDSKKYQEWLDEGNTPLPADPKPEKPQKEKDKDSAKLRLKDLDISSLDQTMKDIILLLRD